MTREASYGPMSQTNAQPGPAGPQTHQDQRAEPRAVARCSLSAAHRQFRCRRSDRPRLTGQKPNLDEKTGHQRRCRRPIPTTRLARCKLGQPRAHRGGARATKRMAIAFGAHQRCSAAPPVNPWMLANLDREAQYAADVSLFECKCGINGARLWKDGAEYVQLQVMHQLAVTGRHAAKTSPALDLRAGATHPSHRTGDDELIQRPIELERRFRA